MKISGIKVIANGLKGLEVNYASTGKDENGREIIVDMWQGRKVPIGPELTRVINAFRFFIYDIYGYDMEKVNDAEMEILGIKAGNGSFLLSGKMKVLDGTKTVAVNTPLVTSQDEYDKYLEVDKLIGQLYTLVAEYMAGKHVMSDSELVKRYSEGKKDKEGNLFDPAEFDKLPIEVQEEKALEILAKRNNYVAVPMGDMGIVAEGEEKNDAVGISSSNTVVMTGEEQIFLTKNAEADVDKKGSMTPNFDAVEEKREIVLEETEDELVLAVTPVKQ